MMIRGKNVVSSQKQIFFRSVIDHLVAWAVMCLVRWCLSLKFSPHTWVQGNLHFDHHHHQRTWHRSRSVFRFLSKLLPSLLLWWLLMWKTARWIELKYGQAQRQKQKQLYQDLRSSERWACTWRKCCSLEDCLRAEGWWENDNYVQR